MPLTFPSHAAAILPLLHLRGTRRLPASALVVGSAAPDLIYLVGTLGAAAHRPPGLLLFCLPAGLLAFVYLEALLLPVLGPPLTTLAPDRSRPTIARLVGPRPLPRTAAAWLAVAVAVVLGAATHQLWDGFTHAWLWPASALYPDSTLAPFGRPILAARLLQHLSSALGLALVLVYLVRTAPPADTTSSPLPGARRAAARRLLALLALPLAGGLVAAAVQLHEPDPLLTRALWNAAWSAAACAAALLGAVCLAARLRPGP